MVINEACCKMHKVKPALLLLPNLLANHKYHQPFLPQSVDTAVETLDGLIAESETKGRRYLSRFNTKRPVREIPIAVYDHDSLDFFLEPILQGERWGFVSDAGLPCIADPGHLLVFRARELGVTIQAFVGPSSIMLALMLSGLPAQRFQFLGYLPKKQVDRECEIQAIEKRVKTERGTELFIEVPYRNQHLLESCLKTLSDEVILAVCWELTTPEQGVMCHKISVWKKLALPELKKRNCVFLVSI